MIEYVEIRNEKTEVIGLVDTAKSIIWHSVYFGVGDFEIYAPVTADVLRLLRVGYYVTRPDNAEIGIIESVSVSNNDHDGLMIVASGRFAKSILDRRVIYNISGTVNKPYILRGNVETAVRNLISANAIACADTRRNIPILTLGERSYIPLFIVDENGNAAEKQVTNENLLLYTDSVLAEYGIGSTVVLDGGKLLYTVRGYKDRSADNIAGNIPIVFSQEFDNLTESEYLYNSTTEKNAALIGGEGEGIERFYSLVAGSASGLNLREAWLDASSISKTYKDDNEEEHTYTDAEYKKVLDVQGKQMLSKAVATETFSGTLDITNGNWVYNRDFSLGDIVTIQDNEIGKYANVRISQITEVQDEDGYMVEAIYQ